MDSILYILLGVLDVIAILVLIFKIFRWPFWEYLTEVIIIGVVLSIVSYLLREVLNIPEFDMTGQFILYVLFFRYLIKVRLFDSISISAIGYLFFVGVQFLVYSFLLTAGIVTTDDAQNLTGLGTYIIQITNQLICFLIAWLIYKFNLGFAYIIRPPHDIYRIIRKDTTQKLFYVFNTLGILAVCSTMSWVLNYHGHLYIVLPSVLGSLLILIYLSKKRDYNS